MNYKTILFDADNTLLDFDDSEQNALKLIFEKYNIDNNKDNIKLYMDINHKLWKLYEIGQMDRDYLLYHRFDLLFEKLNLKHDGKEAELFYQNYLNMGHKILDGAEEMLEKIKNDFRLYIVTNGVGITQHTRMKDSKLERFFLNLFISDEIGYQKPSFEFYNHVKNNISNFDKDTTVIIGDSLSSDVALGNNNNIDTIWFNPKGVINNTDIKPTYEVHSFEEMINILYKTC